MIKKEQLTFILLNGAMGSGKSSITGILENKLKRTAILEIENIRSLISDFRKGKEDNVLAWKVIYRMCDEYFKNEVSVLLKQTVASQDMVNTFLRLARKNGCVIGFYHLQAPREILLERIKKRKKAKNISKTLVVKNIKKHEEIKYTNATVIDTSKMKPIETAKFILKDLSLS